MRLTFSIIFSICALQAAFAEPNGNAARGETSGITLLEELRTAPRPKQQGDLDTVQLATAHREQAGSVEEKTNGLWQSWLTSVCEGCGDSPSYRKTVADDFANRRGFVSRGSGATAAGEPTPGLRREKQEQYARRLYSDLSPETVGQIRRMPRQ